MSLLVAREMLRPIPRTRSSPKGNAISSSSTSTHSKQISSDSTTIEISDDEDDSDIEIIDVGPGVSNYPNYQRILAERVTLNSSPATSRAASKRMGDAGSKAQRDRIIANAMSSSPVSSDKDEVEQLIRSKADAHTRVILYVFTKVNRFEDNNIFCSTDALSRSTATSRASTRLKSSCL